MLSDDLFDYFINFKYDLELSSDVDYYYENVMFRFHKDCYRTELFENDISNAKAQSEIMKWLLAFFEKKINRKLKRIAEKNNTTYTELSFRSLDELKKYINSNDGLHEWLAEYLYNVFDDSDGLTYFFTELCNDDPYPLDGYIRMLNTCFMSYLAYFPFIMFGIDTNQVFEKDSDYEQWETKLHLQLLQSGNLNYFIEAKCFIASILKLNRGFEVANETAGCSIDYYQCELKKLETDYAKETAWKQQGDNLPPELYIAHMVWNEKYRDNKLPHHSHSSAVETIMKRNDFLPQNDRLIYRIKRITTPVKLKNDPKWKDIFKFEDS